MYVHELQFTINRVAITTPRLFHTAAASSQDIEYDQYEQEDEEDIVATNELTSSPSFQPPEDDKESRDFAIALSKICWETKGEDILLLHVAPLVYWTRYMLFATVFSRPQLNAILAKVEKSALEDFDRQPQAPASGQSAWELLDFGDVVVHVMTAEQRDYYDIEGFYGAAEEVELPFAGQENGTIEWNTKL